MVGGRGRRLSTWVGNLALLVCEAGMFSPHSAQTPPWELLSQAGLRGQESSLGPRGHKAPFPSRDNYLSYLSRYLLDSVPAPCLLSVFPVGCVCIGPQERSLDLFLPAALIPAEGHLTSCPSVSLPAICLPIPLIAADSLAPGLHFMMSG